jgi:proteasome accessory factor A
MKRLAGLETEYGCLAPESFGLPAVPTRVRDHLFKKRKLGLIDLHDRDYDEPAGNGGFLFNGGRLYLDMGHVEYCTPECLSLTDVVTYDHVGEVLLQEALKELHLDGEVSFLKNNIDHYTSATFGCHENYLLNRDAPLTRRNVDTLLTFLALRILMVGAGRVGITLAPRRYGRSDSGDFVPYQVSQRADFIQTDIYEWVQFNRALINARDEPLADYRRFRRLHLLLGDSNLLPFNNALKVGATALMLDLLEADALPTLALEQPVDVMRKLSHQPNGPWQITLADGRSCSALDVLEEFLQAASSGKIELDADGKWTVEAWRLTLDKLRHDPPALIGKVDWITKQFLLQSFVDAEKITWRDSWLESLDLEYHNLNPAKSLLAGLPGTALKDQGLPHLPKRDFFTQPPPDTRANLRSEAMRTILNKKLSYVIDWDLIYIGEGKQIHLDDPFVHDIKTLHSFRPIDHK